MQPKLNPFEAGLDSAKFYFSSFTTMLPAYFISFIFFVPATHIGYIENAGIPSILLSYVLSFLGVGFVMYNLYHLDTEPEKYCFNDILNKPKAAATYMLKALGYAMLSLLFTIGFTIVPGLIIYVLILLKAPLFLIFLCALLVAVLTVLFYARLQFYQFTWLDSSYRTSIIESFKHSRGYSWRAFASQSFCYLLMLIPVILVGIAIGLALTAIMYIQTSEFIEFQNFPIAAKVFFHAFLTALLTTPYYYAFLQYYKQMKAQGILTDRPVKDMDKVL